ncbi:MAG TPA: helix-turn-helix domain-containing protein [Flavobacteriales bacterium]|nr:helix-turn-helix domain-containing protein [Flavobacteriales bacterium]
MDKPAALDPERQGADRDARIISALERLSEVVRNRAWDTGRELGLSPLHVQVLAFLATHPASMRRASALVSEFHLSKPTVSVALRKLEERGYLKQVPGATDARTKDLRLTAKGERAGQVAAGHLNVLLTPLASLSTTDRDDLYTLLFQLLSGAQRSGLVKVERMCLTCAHFDKRKGGAFCKLLQKPLKPYELRVDCPEHEVVERTMRMG